MSTQYSGLKSRCGAKPKSWNRDLLDFTQYFVNFISPNTFLLDYSHLLPGRLFRCMSSSSLCVSFFFCHWWLNCLQLFIRPAQHSFESPSVFHTAKCPHTWYLKMAVLVLLKDSYTSLIETLTKSVSCSLVGTVSVQVEAPPDWAEPCLWKHAPRCF